MDTSIIEKIQKLLALSESSNENEAQLSLLKAQSLLVKHKLSLREVKEFQADNSSIIEQESNVSFTKAKWKAQLAMLIAENFGCYIYFKTYYTNQIVFFGREEDAKVCQIVLEYAIDTITSKVKRLKYQQSKEGYSTKGLENDYALGFIVGLKDKFEEQRQSNKDWGLILVKDQDVVNLYENKSFKKEIDTKLNFKGNEDVYFEGKEDGQNFSISDKIAGNDDEQLTIG